MKVQWFARGGDIARMGPGRVITLLFPPDAFVWPEEVPTKKARKK